MFHLHATFIPLFLLFLSPSCCLQGISYPYPCSHGNKSLSFSCAATFYNMEVTLFYLTTFFPLFISLSMIVENFQCVCSDSICVSTVEKQNKQKKPQLNEFRPSLFSWHTLNSSFLYLALWKRKELLLFKTLSSRISMAGSPWIELEPQFLD